MIKLLRWKFENSKIQLVCLEMRVERDDPPERLCEMSIEDYEVFQPLFSLLLHSTVTQVNMTNLFCRNRPAISRFKETTMAQEVRVDCLI
jgi:hypothetical protein